MTFNRRDAQVLAIGAVAGIGVTLLLGATSMDSPGARYQLSTTFTAPHGGSPGVYRIDTLTGEVHYISGAERGRVTIERAPQK